jgi:branched-chain amino acid transport system substrate-binding protein
LILPLVTVAACGGGSSNTGVSGSGSEGNLVLGAMEDLTGPGANGGEAQSTGLKFFVDQTNKAGGIDGHQIELKFCDTQSTPTGGATCARDLSSVNSHVVLLGGALPSTKGGLNALSTKVIGSSVLPVLFPKNDTQVFQASPAVGALVAPFLSAVKSAGLHTVGVLNTSDASGTSQLKAVQDGASAMGLQVVAQVVSPDATDVTTSLLQLKSSGADAIFLASIGQASTTGLTAYHTLNLNLPVVVGAQAVTNTFLNSLSFPIPAKLYGISTLLVGSKDISPQAQEAWKAYDDAFKSFAKEPPDEETTSAQYSACIAEAALKATKEGTAADMTKWLSSNPITCLGSTMKFAVPGFNVVTGQPTALVQAGPNKSDGWHQLQGSL